MIKNNIGFSIVNEASVKNELINNDIKTIYIKERIFKDKIVIAYKNNKNSETIHKFIEILENQYKEN